MTIYDILFLLAFMTLIGITLAKLYNLFSVGEFYDIRMGFILFILFFIAYAVAMVNFMILPERTIYMVLFKFQTWFVWINTLFMVIEVIMHIKLSAVGGIKAYKPVRAR
jgi:hypothetical protein